MSANVRELARVRVARDRLVGKLLDALDAYEADKDAYRRHSDPTVYMRPGRTLSDAEVVAKSDPRTVNAAGLGQWHQGEVAAYATALIALNTLPEDYDND